MESKEKIQLLQFFICKDFQTSDEQDCYTAEGILSNKLVRRFPRALDDLHVVTCWRKDERFHKEVIEYETAYGKKLRTPPMDIEPVKGSVLFRWHKHRFPSDFLIEKSTLLTVRVFLDWQLSFETYIMIEGKS
ncbi:MAG: hypothetical protein HYZ84_02585 [Candidatus Omnitrophica bacterium]|nr:hypothetical protein [Candidatus Omnitrophota bacterium]